MFSISVVYFKFLNISPYTLEWQCMERQKCICNDDERRQLYFVQAKNFIFGELSKKSPLNVLVKAQKWLWMCSVTPSVGNLVPFCGICKHFHLQMCVSTRFSTWTLKIFLIVCGSSRWNLWCLLFLCPLSNRSKALLRKHLFFCYSSNIIFLRI